MADRGPHHLHPVLWDAAAVPLEISRDHLALEQAEQTLGLGLVIDRGPVKRGAGRDRPPELGPVRLVPPAIEDADVQHPVRAGLHAAGAAGLEKAFRIVEPYV